MSFTDLKVSNTNSHWVFLSASSEPRHTYDIIFGVDCLRRRGVTDDFVHIFIDSAEARILLHVFGITKNVHTTDQMEAVLAKLPDSELLFLSITGHGGMEGIQTASGQLLSPTKVINVVRAKPNLKAGVLVIGQCYAGTFNYTDASAKPEMCFLGATNLHLSFSTGMSLQAPIQSNLPDLKLESWLANAFFVYFFNWLLSPKDIDGDGRNSLVDAYKYAGVSSNSRLRELKGSMSYSLDEWLLKEKERLKTVDELTGTAIKTKIDSQLEVFHLHQEAWILHPVFGRHILF